MDKNSTMVPFYYAHYMMFNDIFKKLYKIWNGVTGTPRPYAKLTSLSSSSNLSLLLYRQVWKGLKWDQSCHRTVREKANGSVTQNVKHWFSHLCEEVLGGCASGGRGDHLLIRSLVVWSLAFWQETEHRVALIQPLEYETLGHRNKPLYECVCKWVIGACCKKRLGWSN